MVRAVTENKKREIDDTLEKHKTKPETDSPVSQDELNTIFEGGNEEENWSANSPKDEIDPLLECLVIFTTLHNRPFSAEALTQGLPVEPGRTKPELFTTGKAKSNFSRAAKRAGFTSKLVKRSLDEISPLVLPCILMLKDKNACILVGFDAEKKFAKVIVPELGDTVNWVSIEALSAEYMGFAFYIKKEMAYKEEKARIRSDNKSHWFWGTLWRNKDIYRDVIIASLLINMFVLATPLFTMNVYDRVVPNNAIETLWVLAIGIMIIYVFDLVLKSMRTYFLEMAAKKSDIIMSSILFERVLDLQMEHHPKSIGGFANSLKEFDTLRNFLTSSTLATLIDLPFVFIFLVTLYYISGPIAVVPVTTIFIIVAYTMFIKNPLHESIESTYESASQKNAVLIESLSALETIKTMGAVGNAQHRWEESTGDIAQKSLRSKMLNASIGTVTGMLVQLNTVLIIIVGVYMIQERDLTMGGLVASVILASRAIAPMGQVASLRANYEHTKTSFESLEQIMQLPVERPEGKKFVERPSFKGEIEFKNVSFTYPESAKSSLEEVTFHIKPGEHVGIIGKVGSGKTSLQKLMMGLYKPTKGAVLVDGIDIHQVDPADLRRNIGYVPQDVVLFRGTVKENIVYKAPHVDDETILRAAEVGGVKEFTDKHPQGFDMPVGERGMGLSGGQKQNIAISRGFLLDAPIMLLDEPTNSMDTGGEMKIIASLKKNLKGKTAIVITHKMTLLELVDRLIVVDDGRIVLDGRKEQVLQALKGGGKA